MTDIIKTTRGSDLINNTDIGIWSPATVETYVWLDGNSNGRQDSAESGIDGVTVNLLSNGSTVATQLTSNGGVVTFTNVAANSDYNLEYILPAGHSFTLQDVGSDLIDSDVSPSTGLSSPFSTNGGSLVITDIDAGMTSANASIETFVWDDLDGDSSQDTNEPGIENISVDLLSSSGDIVDTQTTNSSGLVVFSGLAGNTNYRLKYDLPEKHSFVPRDIGDDSLDSDASTSNGTTALFSVPVNTTVTNFDAGMWSPGSVQTFVWDDLDGDGRQDAGEPGLNGIEVNLLNQFLEIIETKTTVNGFVTFTNVQTTLIRRLEYVLPTNHEYTLVDRGVNDNIDSDVNRNNGRTDGFRLLKGQAVENTYDAGLWTPGIIETFVWDDINEDGIQDSGEPGLVGVEVELLMGTNVIDTEFTDGTGTATFTNVPADQNMRLRFNEPSSDYKITTRNVGSDDSIDSDPAIATGLTGIFSADRGNQLFTDIDAGMYAVIALSQENGTPTLSIIDANDGDFETIQTIEKSTDLELKVYPNPVVDFLVVEFTELTEQGQLVLTNSIGQIVWTKKLQEGDNQRKIDIASMRLESGIYQLIFTTGDNYQTRKVYIVN